MDVTVCRPYVPDLLSCPGDLLNSMRYNKLIDSTSYVKIGVPNTLLGSIERAINQYLLIKNSIVLGPNSKDWGKNTVLHSIGKYVGNVFKIVQEVDQSGNQ